VRFILLAIDAACILSSHILSHPHFQPGQTVQKQLAHKLVKKI